MIILIEGPRGSGKTHLSKKLKDYIIKDENVDEKDIIFYKYDFVNHMKTLNMEDQEGGAGLHYFTISNTLTILELHKTILKDKVFIFDRGIFSAYAWSIFRKRLDSKRLNIEFMKLLKNDLYHNCHIVYVTTDTPIKRHKDIFDKFDNYGIENESFNNLFKLNTESINNLEKNNSVNYFKNNMDDISESLFVKTLINIIETRKF
jgi:thymidylate kinase